jgi:hypothetical protein
MGMFNNLVSRILGHPIGSIRAGLTPPDTPNMSIESATASSPTTPAASAIASATPAPSAPSAAPAETADVTAILDERAAKHPEKLDWKGSIVDLLKLVDMDSSLSARKELAAELNIPGDQNDSAAMNVWLHKQVLRRLAEHGGKIPRELL